MKTGEIGQSNIPEGAWYRTCQECGNRQVDKEPTGELTVSYRNRKCKRCKSEALDYGTRKTTDESE